MYEQTDELRHFHPIRHICIRFFNLQNYANFSILKKEYLFLCFVNHQVWFRKRGIG